MAVSSSVTLTIEQGSTFKKTFTCKSGGVPIDLTGCSIEFKASAMDAGSMVYTTASGHITLTEPTEGKMVITLSNSVTANFTWGTAKFNIHATFPSGDVRKLLKGNLKLEKRV